MATIADKLRIKPGTTVWSSDAACVALLGALPDGVRAVERLAEAGFDPVYGARPLKRRIERDLLAPVAEAVNRAGEVRGHRGHLLPTSAHVGSERSRRSKVRPRKQVDQLIQQVDQLIQNVG